MWRRAGAWVVAGVLVAFAPFPLAVGTRMLSGRGATPLTAAVVTVSVTVTIFCLVAGVVAVWVAFRLPPADPVSRGARHTAPQVSLGDRVVAVAKRSPTRPFHGPGVRGRRATRGRVPVRNTAQRR